MMLLEEAQITGLGFNKKAQGARKAKEKRVTAMMFDNPIPSGGKKKKKKNKRKSKS